MTALTKALDEIKFDIPYEVLHLAFVELDAYAQNVTSLDERILNSVIRAKVMVDANLVGGVQMVIPLSKCDVRFQDMVSTAFYVPKELTGGRSIVSALSILPGMAYGTVNNTSGELLGAANKLMGSLGNHSLAQTARLELVGDNVILIEENTYNTMLEHVRVMVENDVNMGNLNPRTYLTFGELCIHATKAYIYNKMIVSLNKGFIYSGHELGIIKEIIDSYVDEGKEYRAFLKTTWQKTALLDNNMQKDRIIKAMFGATT